MRYQQLLSLFHTLAMPSALIFSLLSCSTEETCIDCRGPDDCVSNETRECPCDCSAGLQTCGPGGVWGACECPCGLPDASSDVEEEIEVAPECITAPPIRYGDPCCDPDAYINVDECNYCVCNPTDGAEGGLQWQCTASACDADDGG